MLDVGCWMLDSCRANGRGDGVRANGCDHANDRGDGVRASGCDHANDRGDDELRLSGEHQTSPS